LSEAGKNPEAACTSREVLTLSEKVRREIRYFGGTGTFFKGFQPK